MRIEIHFVFSFPWSLGDAMVNKEETLNSNVCSRVNN